MRSGFSVENTPRIGDAAERTRALIEGGLSDATRAFANFGLSPNYIRLQLQAYLRALNIGNADRVEVFHTDDPTVILPRDHGQFQSVTVGVFRPNAEGRFAPVLRDREVRLPSIDIAAKPLGYVAGRWGLVELPWNHYRSHQITPLQGDPIIAVPHHAGGFLRRRPEQKGAPILAQDPHLYMHLDDAMDTDHSIAEPRPSIIFREYFDPSYF